MEVESSRSVSRWDLDDLDDDCIKLVLGFLGILNLAVAAQVSRRWRRLVRELNKQVRSIHLSQVFKGQGGEPSWEQVRGLLRAHPECEKISFASWRWDPPQQWREVASKSRLYSNSRGSGRNTLIDGFPLSSAVSSFVQWARFEGIRALDFSGHELTALDFRSLGKGCPNVTSLSVVGSINIQDETIGLLAFIWSYSLMNLDISGCPNISNGGIRTAFSANLKNVTAKRCEKISGLLVLSHSPDRSIPRSLNLGSCRNLTGIQAIGSLSLSSLNLSQSTKLKSVEISSDQLDTLTLSGCRNLTQLQLSPKHLRELSVYGCRQLSAQSVVDSLNIQYPLLRKLDINGIHSTSSALRILSASLEILDMSGIQGLGSVWITAENLRKLRMGGIYRTVETLMIQVRLPSELEVDGMNLESWTAKHQSHSTMWKVQVI